MTAGHWQAVAIVGAAVIGVVGSCWITSRDNPQGGETEGPTAVEEVPSEPGIGKARSGEEEPDEEDRGDSSLPLIRSFPVINSLDEADSLMERIKKELSLRSLQPLEADQAVKEISAGTAFVVDSGQLMYLADTSAIVTTQGFATSAFRMHKLHDSSIHLYGFTTGEAAARIVANKGMTPIELTIVPMPWSPFDTLVDLPMERIADVRRVRIVPYDEFFSIDLVDMTVQ